MLFPTIASISLFLAAASAESYLVERDPGFKSAVKSAWNSVKGGAKADAQAYQNGFSSGYNKRDLELREAKNYFNALLKADAKAMGTIQGAAAKAFLGSRDVEDIYIREPSWQSTASQAATAVEKSLGTVAGKLGRTLVGGAFTGKGKRDVEDMWADELYIRSLFEDDMFEDAEGWY